MADPKKGGINRSERLRAALRENLRRRKAQAKGRSAQHEIAFSSEVGTGSREENALKQKASSRDDDIDVGGASGSPNSAGFAPDKPKV